MDIDGGRTSILAKNPSTEKGYRQVDYERFEVMILQVYRKGTSGGDVL